MAAREAPPTTGAAIATDLGICPHCQQADGVERYMLGQLPTADMTDARYCSHCDTRWLGHRQPKPKAAA